MSWDTVQAKIVARIIVPWVTYLLSQRSGRASLATVLRLSLASLALVTSVRVSYSDEECVFPEAYGAAFVRPENRLGEFRIALKPPNYGSSPSVRNHLAYLDVWARLLSAELVRRTRGVCHAIASDFLFPDVRVYLFNDDSYNNGEFDCLQQFKDVVVKWEPRATAISEAALQEAEFTRELHTNPQSNMGFAHSILRAALVDIYKAGTVMHSIVSVDADPTIYQSLDTQALAAWIDDQRSGDSFGLGRLSLCDPQVDPQSPRVNHSSKRLPRSESIPAGAVNLSIQFALPTLPPALHHVVIVGDDRGVANTRYNPAAVSKYCNKEREFDVGPGSTAERGGIVRVRCVAESVHNIDGWIEFFCEPEDCRSEHAAQVVAAAIAADPDVLELAKGTNGASRGPYAAEVNSHASNQ